MPRMVMMSKIYSLQLVQHSKLVLLSALLVSFLLVKSLLAESVGNTAIKKSNEAQTGIAHPIDIKPKPSDFVKIVVVDVRYLLERAPQFKIESSRVDASFLEQKQELEAKRRAV